MLSTGGHTLAGKRIGIFGKGGCGKSTVSVLLARGLRRMGYPIVLVDADSTNMGLSAVLGLEQSPRPLIEYFGGMVFSGGAVTCPVDDPTELAESNVSLDRLPREFVGRIDDGFHLLVAGKMGELGPGAGCDGPISKIARDLRVHGGGRDCVTLVDFKAGFEDPSRGVLIGLDWALVVVDPTVAAIQMAVDLREAIQRIRAGALPATAHLGHAELVDLAHAQYRHARIEGTLCALNKVPDEATEHFLRVKLATTGMDPIGVIHTHPSIGHSWLRGRPLRDAGADEEAGHLAKRLEAASAAVAVGAP